MATSSCSEASAKVFLLCPCQLGAPHYCLTTHQEESMAIVVCIDTHQKCAHAIVRQKKDEWKESTNLRLRPLGLPFHLHQPHPHEKTWSPSQRVSQNANLLSNSHVHKHNMKKNNGFQQTYTPYTVNQMKRMLDNTALHLFALHRKRSCKPSSSKQNDMMLPISESTKILRGAWKRVCACACNGKTIYV